MIIRYLIVVLILLLAALILKKSMSYAQPHINHSSHEITVFTIPSVKSVDWQNPSELYKSTLKCYTSSIFKKNYYVIGHMSAIITSPMLESTVYAGMTGASQKEKVQQVLINKLGLGIFGTTLKGKMEPVGKMKKTISFYAKRGKLAYMRFRVNEEAIRRVMQFITYFQEKNEFGYVPCTMYNGALNPIYHYEGAACSSFIIALMDAAGILPESAPQKWAVNLNLPMHLIGGKMNDNKRVSLKSIIKTKEWHDGSGVEGIDYAHLELYDPALIYDWIQQQRAEAGNTEFVKDSNGIFKGVYADKSTVTFNEDEGILKERPSMTFFVKNFLDAKVNGHLKVELSDTFDGQT